MSGFRKCGRAQCHTWGQNSEHSPQSSDFALLDRLTERTDTLGGVCAVAILDTTERIIVQTAVRVTPAVRMCDMAQCHT